MERTVGWRRLVDAPEPDELVRYREVAWQNFRDGLNRSAADFILWSDRLGNRPKADRLLDFRYDMSIESIIHEVKELGYQFVGVRPILPFLFQERNRWRFMWEFVWEAASGKPVDRKYLYVPVDQGFLEQLTAVVPSMLYFCPFQQYWYPTRPVLAQLDIEGLALIQVRVRRLTHSFLPGFIGTGRMIEFPEDNLYEYVDAKGWWGPQYETYWSPIRPLQLDFPRGIPWDGDLFKQPVGPNVLSWVIPWNGRYTGYETTSQYGPWKYWLFERENGTVYLDRFENYTARCAEAFCPAELNDAYLVDDTFCFGNSNLRLF